MPWRRQVPWLRLIGLILLGVLLWRVDVAALFGIIRHANRYILIVAVILNLPMVLLKSLRWKALMQSQGIRYPVGNAYLAYFGSIFVGFLTPGRLGEFVRVIHVNQDCDVPLGRAFSNVLADRLFDLYVLFLVGGGALLTLTVGNAELIALAGSALVLTLPLVLFLNNTTFGWLQQVGHRLDLGSQKLFALGRWLVEMRVGLRQLTRPWLLVAIILTVLAYAIFFGQCYLLAMALQLPVGFVHISFAVALGSLVTLIPISISGLGTREAAIVAYLSTVGVLAEAALGLSLLVFLTFYVGGGLMGAVAWWLKPVPLARGKTKSQSAAGRRDIMV
jgi:uncharacterized protein (TIRG00374 family)